MLILVATVTAKNNINFSNRSNSRKGNSNAFEARCNYTSNHYKFNSETTSSKYSRDSLNTVGVASQARIILALGIINKEQQYR